MDKKVKKIIKFSASWCNPCKLFAPHFEAVSKMKEFENLEFSSFDVDDEEAGELVKKYQIMNVPAVMLTTEEGEPIFKLVGNIPEQDLVEIIKNSL